MLFNFKQLVNLTRQVTKQCEFQTSLFNENVLSRLKCVFPEYQKQNFHTDTPRNKHSDILEYRRAQKEAAGKMSVNEPFEQDLVRKRKEGYFPTVDLPNTLFDNIPYKNLPIVYILVSRNNTHLRLANEKGLIKMSRSCGMEGFKNAKKGTNVAAQATGASFAMRAVKKGYKTVRVVLKGLGPGRLSSIKGLQLGGIDVVSISDETVDFTERRPRKQRRL